MTEPVKDSTKSPENLPSESGFFHYVKSKLQRIGLLPKPYEKISVRISDISSSDLKTTPPPSRSRSVSAVNLSEVVDTRGLRAENQLDTFSRDLLHIDQLKDYLSLLQNKIRSSKGQEKQNFLSEYDERKNELLSRINSMVYRQLLAIYNFNKEEYNAGRWGPLSVRRAFAIARIDDIANLETDLWVFLKSFENEIDGKTNAISEEEKANFHKKTHESYFTEMEKFFKSPKPLPPTPYKPKKAVKTSVAPVAEPMTPTVPITTITHKNSLSSFVENILSSFASVIKDITNFFTSRKKTQKPFFNETEILQQDLKKIRNAVNTIQSESDFKRVNEMLNKFLSDSVLENIIQEAKANKTLKNELSQHTRDEIAAVFYGSHREKPGDLEERKEGLNTLISELENAFEPKAKAYSVKGPLFADVFNLDEEYLSNEMIPEEPEFPPIKTEEQVIETPQKATNLGEFRALEEEKQQIAKQLLDKALGSNDKRVNLYLLLHPKNRKLLDAFVEYAKLEGKFDKVDILPYIADLYRLKDDQDAFAGVLIPFYNIYIKNKVSPEQLKVIDKLIYDNYFMVDSTSKEELSVAAIDLLKVINRNLIDEQFRSEILSFESGSILQRFVTWANA